MLNRAITATKPPKGPRRSIPCLNVSLVFVGLVFLFIAFKAFSDTNTGGTVDLGKAVRTVVLAAGHDRTAFQKLFRDAGASVLVDVAKDGSGAASEPIAVGEHAPFDYYKDERSIYGQVNYQTTRTNSNLMFRRLACKDAVATSSVRKGADLVTDFVEEGYKELGCPLGPNCLDMPVISSAKAHFVSAIDKDPTCVSALLNAATVTALGPDLPDEDEIDKFVQPLLRVPELHLAVKAKAYLLKGIVLERLGRSSAHEYDLVRRTWPEYCVQYSAFKCDTRFFPWRLLADAGARTEAGRTAEKNAVLRMLLAAEYQTIHLGMMGNVTEADARMFPKRHFVVVRNMMAGYALAMHQYSWLTLINTNSIPFGDPQVRTRYGHANDAPSNLMRGMLNEIVQSLMGRPIKPTYSYFGGYRDGSVLSPHTDRLACEFTMSMTLYFDPPDKPWGFLIDDRAITVKPEERGGARPRPEDAHLVNITLWPGDAGVIRGRRVVHFRDGYSGRLLLQQFHHFVFDDFPESSFGK